MQLRRASSGPAWPASGLDLGCGGLLRLLHGLRRASPWEAAAAAASTCGGASAGIGRGGGDRRLERGAEDRLSGLRRRWPRPRPRGTGGRRGGGHLDLGRIVLGPGGAEDRRFGAEALRRGGRGRDRCGCGAGRSALGAARGLRRGCGRGLGHVLLVSTRREAAGPRARRAGTSRRRHRRPGTPAAAERQRGTASAACACRGGGLPRGGTAGSGRMSPRSGGAGGAFGFARHARAPRRGAWRRCAACELGLGGGEQFKVIGVAALGCAQHLIGLLDLRRSAPARRCRRPLRYRGGTSWPAPDRRR